MCEVSEQQYTQCLRKGFNKTCKGFNQSSKSIFILSKPLGGIDFLMCPGIKFKDQPDFTRLHLLLTSVNILSHFSDILNLPNDLSSLCLCCFCRL